MTRPGGLGRGLSALIPAAGPGESGLLTVRPNELVPNARQPRGAFDEHALEELAQSLREVGLLQPIVVRPLPDGRYEIIAGERRARAARLAGLETVPVVVRSTDDNHMLTEALVENIHRADLNPLEEAAAYQQLLDDFGFTHEELAKRVGKSRSAITNALRLLTLPPALQQQVAAGVLSAGHARALLALEHGSQQQQVASRVVQEGLSVRATEELVRRMLEQPRPGEALDDLAAAARKRHRSPLAHLQRRLADAFATRVHVKGDAKRGKVIIDYSGEEDLQRLLAIFSRGTGEDLLQDA